MFNAYTVSTRLINITSFYEIGEFALKDRRLMKKYISQKREEELLRIKTHDNLPEADKWLNEESREFILSKKGEAYTKRLAKKSAKFSINALRAQTIVMMHSHIEIVMCEIVSMILEKNEDILKRIYESKDSFPFDISDLLDNKKSILKMLIDKESNRFSFLSMEKKARYYKKYFNMDILNWSDFPHFSTDLLKIDKLRHDIIHSNKDIKVSRGDIYSTAFYLGHFGDYLLKTAKAKHDIDIIWNHPLKKDK